MESKARHAAIGDHSSAVLTEPLKNWTAKRASRVEGGIARRAVRNRRCWGIWVRRRKSCLLGHG